MNFAFSLAKVAQVKQTSPPGVFLGFLPRTELARSGRHVDVGCAGGIGRTGTVHACMALFAGIPAREVIS